MLESWQDCRIVGGLLLHIPGSVFYQQKEGAGMGSPVSAVVANQSYLRSLHSTLPLLDRECGGDVDDIFCIIWKGTENKLLDHLNSIQPYMM